MNTLRMTGVVRLATKTGLLASSLILSACAGVMTKPDFPVKFEGELRAPDDQSAIHSSSELSIDEELRRRQLQAEPSTMGSLYKKNSYSSMFEARKARNVGDLITVNIIETVAARQTSNTNVSREDSASIDFPVIKGLFKGGITGEANSSKEFDGGGSSSASNEFVGSITVSVVKILSNGNMLVAGEKQIGTNNEIEFIRMSGVVDPRTIQPGNQVPSSQIGDVKVQYTGRGAIDSAQTMGWLSRVFLSVSPF